MIWGPFMRKVMADWHQMCHKLSAERCQAKQSSINIQWLQIYWSLQIQILLVCASLFQTTVTSLSILRTTHVRLDTQIISHLISRNSLSFYSRFKTQILLISALLPHFKSEFNHRIIVIYNSSSACFIFTFTWFLYQCSSVILYLILITASIGFNF